MRLYLPSNLFDALENFFQVNLLGPRRPNFCSKLPPHGDADPLALPGAPHQLRKLLLSLKQSNFAHVADLNIILDD
jgi:hypothetical protein